MGRSVAVDCGYCGKTFLKRVVDVNRTNHNFCCKKCAGKFWSQTAEKDFWNKSIVDCNGCRIWSGSKDKYGYGTLRLNGKSERAHVVAYMLSRSSEDTAGKCVCHTCDNPSCVNPAHLFLGTHAENMADMQQKLRGHRKYGPRTVSEARTMGGNVSQIARKLGVSERSVRRMKQKKNGEYQFYTHWQTLPQPPKGED